MATAQDRGWGPGWPHCQPANIKTLVRADGIRIPVHKSIIEIVAYLMDKTEHDIGYNLVPGWCWGYACRAIRGSKSPSNHSWGLALDLNAPNNPMGSKLITDMPSSMVKLWEAHMFRWGGTYKSRPDAMHYEFMGTPADAARITKQIRDGKSPGVAGLPIRLTKPYTESLLVAAVQLMLNEFNAKNRTGPQIAVDGVYGPRTAMCVSAFKMWVVALQKSLGLPQWPNTDTVVGPIMYGALQFWTQ